MRSLDRILPTHSPLPVWSVAILSGSDDIIVGSSDSLVRIFTADSSRHASSEELATFDQAVSSSAINASQVVGDIRKSDLKDESSLLSRQGTKEGEIAMVKNASGGVEAHQWDAAQRKWTKVGEVVDAVGSGRKQLYEGQEYDYVFDVDVHEGQPPLKLPYNVTRRDTDSLCRSTADPFVASQRTHTKQRRSSCSSTTFRNHTSTRWSSSSRRTPAAPHSARKATQIRTRVGQAIDHQAHRHLQRLRAPAGRATPGAIVHRHHRPRKRSCFRM